jgi:hypothetical protein
MESTITYVVYALFGYIVAKDLSDNYSFNKIINILNNIEETNNRIRRHTGA